VVEQNVIAGNVALYGATGGEAYIRGLAGERFCVRNSGANAVVEGVGDHGCEYMTGGRVVILGPTGRNFAAGMSGGIAYVLDENREMHNNLNGEMVGTGPLDDPAEIELVLTMIRRHLEYTGSKRARNVLGSWSEFRPLFVRCPARRPRWQLLSSTPRTPLAFTESKKNGSANRISRICSRNPRGPSAARARRRFPRVPQALARAHHA
jgi:glutamate synthase domain-containing protein 3